MPLRLSVTSSDFDDVAGNVFGTDVETQGYSAHFPVIEFVTGRILVTTVEMNANVRLEHFGNLAAACSDSVLFVVGFIDGNDDDLIWCYFWWLNVFYSIKCPWSCRDSSYII